MHKMSEEKLLDMDELDSITGGDEEIKQDILTSFLDTIFNDVETLQRYIKRELRMEAEVHAHTMKGVARSISAKRLEKIAFSIETLCKEGNLSEARNSVSLVETVVCETVGAIKDLLQMHQLNTIDINDSQCIEQPTTEI